MTQSRFVRSTRSDAAGIVLEYRASRESESPEKGTTLLEDVSLEELARIAKAPNVGIFSDVRSAFILANGWQSWSPGWELGPGERVERARFLSRLNIFTDHPARRPREGEVLSHFLGYVRRGEEYLALASVPSGTPPISFLFDRRKSRVSFLAYAEGGRFAEGDLIASVRVLYARNYFELKDSLRAAYASYDLFRRLSFLAAPGDPLVPGGYESWYNHYSDINEKLILADLDNLAGNGNLIDLRYIRRGKPTVFQVDDGWERAVGDWRADETRFPRGMADTARRIENAGYIPGIWMAPFLVTRFAPLFTERPEWLLKDSKGKLRVAGWIPNWGGNFFCLDLSRPDVLDFLYGIFDRVVNEWGFRYLKLDFLYAGLLSGVRESGDAAFMHYRKALERLTSITRRKDGAPVAYLGCGAPFEPSFEFLPLMRIGADTREEWDYGQLKFLRHPGRPSAWINMKDTIGRALWDGTVFVNDPDVVFCRDRSMRLTKPEKELVALVSRMFASQVMFSDDTADFDPQTEGAFSERIAALYERIDGMEFGPRRVDGWTDVYLAESRDGRLSAVINLSESDADLEGDWPVDKALLAHFSREGNHLIFDRHSISLFDGAPTSH